MQQKRKGRFQSAAAFQVVDESSRLHPPDTYVVDLERGTIMKQFGNLFPSIEAARRAANAAAARAGFSSSPRANQASSTTSSHSTLHPGRADDNPRSPPLSPGATSPNDPLSPRSPCGDDGLGPQSIYPVDPHIIKALTRDELQVLMVDLGDDDDDVVGGGNDDANAAGEEKLGKEEEDTPEEGEGRGMKKKKIQLQEPPPQQQSQHRRGGKKQQKQQRDKKLTDTDIKVILQTLRILVNVSVCVSCLALDGMSDGIDGSMVTHDDDDNDDIMT